MVGEGGRSEKKKKKERKKRRVGQREREGFSYFQRVIGRLLIKDFFKGARDCY